MPKLDFDAKDYDKFIVRLQDGVPYMNVAGRVHLAHNEMQLIGVQSRKVAETEDVVQVQTTITVVNLPLVKLLTDSYGIPFDQIPLELYVNTFTGEAESDKHAVNGQGKPTAEAKKPFEVAATSAAGRALGVAGFGALESVASLDEMFTALTNARASGGVSGGGPTASVKQTNFIKRLAKEKSADLSALIAEKFGAEATIDTITSRQASVLIDALQSSNPEPTRAAF